MCTVSVFKKSNRFKVINSPLISTQVFRARNLIEGEFRGAKIYDQIISWNLSLPDSSFEISNRYLMKLTGTCRFHIKVTEEMNDNYKKYCSHIIGWTPVKNYFYDRFFFFK